MQTGSAVRNTFGQRQFIRSVCPLTIRFNMNSSHFKACAIVLLFMMSVGRYTDVSVSGKWQIDPQIATFSVSLLALFQLNTHTRAF